MCAGTCASRLQKQPIDFTRPLEVKRSLCRCRRRRAARVSLIFMEREWIAYTCTRASWRACMHQPASAISGWAPAEEHQQSTPPLLADLGGLGPTLSRPCSELLLQTESLIRTLCRAEMN